MHLKSPMDGMTRHGINVTSFRRGHILLPASPSRRPFRRPTKYDVTARIPFGILARPPTPPRVTRVPLANRSIGHDAEYTPMDWTRLTGKNATRVGNIALRIHA